MLLKRNEVDVISARITREFIDFQNCGGGLRPRLYKEHVYQILHRSLLMAGNEKLFSRSCESGSSNGGRAKFLPVNYDWIENVLRETVKWLNIHWEGKNLSE